MIFHHDEAKHVMQGQLALTSENSLYQEQEIEKELPIDYCRLTQS